jgi:hypothetical protein
MFFPPLTLCLLLIAAPPAIAQEVEAPPENETLILVPDLAGAKTTSAISRLSPSSLRLGGSEVFDQAIVRANGPQWRVSLKVLIGCVAGAAVLLILWLNSEMPFPGDHEGGAASQRSTSAAVAVAPRMANGPRSLQLSVRF